MVVANSEYSFNINHFFKDVAIAGLRSSLETKSSGCKFLWLMINVLCISATIALCYKSVAYYMLYEVNTKMNVVTQDAHPDFPAITFCTTSFMRTSFLRQDETYRLAYLGLLATWNPGQVEKTVEFMNRSCKDTGVFQTGSIEDNEDNFYKFMDQLSLGYKDIVLLCWFGGERIPCTSNGKYFSQTMNDFGSCFTFNEIRKTSNMINLSSPFKLQGTGPNAGFKFLMNVHQEEYCTVYNVYDGIGLLFGLKENYAPYDFNCDKGFRKIAVGYDVNINVKSAKFVRNTEHLGKCMGKALVDNDGRNPIPYFRGFCFVKELARIFLETCGCVIPSHVMFAPYMNEKNFNFDSFPKNSTHLSRCDGSPKYQTCCFTLLQQGCMKKFLRIMPYCPLPCYETVHTLTFGMKKLSWHALKSKYSNDTSAILRAYHTSTSKVNMTIEKWVEQNLILVNFYHGDSTIDVYIDDQAFTFPMLIIYIANVLGLFYGISFVTLFEIAYGILCTCLNLMFRVLLHKT